jgi:hypothetical protein
MRARCWKLTRKRATSAHSTKGVEMVAGSGFEPL